MAADLPTVCSSLNRPALPSHHLHHHITQRPALQVAAELPVTAGAPDARSMAAAAAAAAVVREAAAAAVMEHLEGESGESVCPCCVMIVLLIFSL